MQKAIFLFLITLINIQAYSQDTFSITAIDTVTLEAGSAGASCIDESAIPTGCYILSDVKPGIGVIHTQAYWHASNQNYASMLMDQGVPPEDIIDSLIANDIQNNPHIRQYGIIDMFDGTVRRAAYTGVNCDDYKNHIIGPNYTIQGNILLGQEILDSMEARFLSTDGPLACKLMAALQGAKVIGADTRCLDDGTSSLSAFLRVAQPLDPPDDLYLDLNVASTPVGMDPIDSLQTLVDNWGVCDISNVENIGTINVLIYPDPFNKTIAFRITDTPLTNAHLAVFDSQGRIIIVQNQLKGHEFKIGVKTPPGLYLYRLFDKSIGFSQGKFLIH